MILRENPKKNVFWQYQLLRLAKETASYRQSMNRGECRLYRESGHAKNGFP